MEGSSISGSQEFFYYYEGEDETEGSRWFVSNENEHNNSSECEFEVVNRNENSSRLPLTICEYNLQDVLMKNGLVSSSGMTSSRKREGGNSDDETVANSACGGSGSKSRKLDDTGSQDSWNGSEMPIRIAPVEEILIEDDDDDEDVVVVYEGKKKTVSENAPGNNQQMNIPGPSSTRTTVIFRNTEADRKTNEIARLQEELDTVRNEKAALEEENGKLKEENGKLKSSMTFLEAEQVVAKDDWDSRLLQAIDDEFKCSICTEIVIEPVTWKCGHIFCAHCIVTWFGQTGSGYRCPTCRDYWGMQKLPLKSFGKFINSIHNLMSSEILKSRKELLEQRAEERNQVARKRTAVSTGRVRRLNFHAPPRSMQNRRRFRVETRQQSPDIQQLRAASSSPGASSEAMDLSSSDASSFGSSSDSSGSSSPTYSLALQEMVRATTGILNNNNRRILQASPPPQAISEGFILRRANSPSPILAAPPPPAAAFEIFPEQPVVRIRPTRSSARLNQQQQ